MPFLKKRLRKGYAHHLETFIDAKIIGISQAFLDSRLELIDRL